MQIQQSKFDIFLTSVSNHTMSSFLFLAAATFLFSIRTSPLCWAHGADEGVYMTSGWLFSQGWLPYQDFFDHKSPLVYVVYAIGWSLGGRWAVWVLENSFFAIAVFMLFRAIRPRFGNASAHVTSLSLIMLSRSLFFYSHGKPEQWALSCFILIAALLIASPERHLIWFLSGVIAAIAFLFKITAVSVPIAIGIIAFLTFIRSSDRVWWMQRIGLLVAGGLVTLGAAALWMLSQGIFGAFYEACFEYNQHYSAIGLQSQSAQRHVTLLIESFFGRGVILLWTGSALLGWISVRHVRSRLLLFIFLASQVAISVETLLIALTGRIFPQYFALATLPFSLCLGIGFADTSRPTHPLSALGKLRWAVGALPLLPFVIVALYWNVLQGLAKPLLEPLPSHPIDAFVLEAVKTHRTNDRLFVWGPVESRFYHQTQTLPATRYIYGLPLWTPGYATAERIKHAMQMLKTHQPSVIVDVLAGSGRGFAGDQPVRWEGGMLGYYRFPDDYLHELRSWVQRHYSIVETHESGVAIWGLHSNRPLPANTNEF